MTYEESVRFLYSLGNELKFAKYDLVRIGVLLEALGNPHRRGRFVHVAGTNGKGSTCAMIESGLRAAGYRTGLYTSPHLAEPTERIRISGEPIGREAFSAVFDEVHTCAERLLASGDLDQHPTYFESVTAMAFLAFDREELDWVVLEVGLGGRLDATNVVAPRLCVITPVDFDHEAWLGRSLDSIAFEKAGILKSGVPAVITPQRPECDRVIRQRAEGVGATLIQAGDWAIGNASSDRRGSRFDVRGLPIVCPLAGEHQIENARTAVVALETIGVPASAIQAGVAAAQWPGRLERVAENPEIVIDGAHNPSGARALAAYLDRFYAGEPLTLIYGAMRDKAVEEVAGTLFPRFAEVIVTAPHQPRALAPESLLEVVDHPRIRMAADLRAAIAQVHQTTFITGSLFLVAEARELL
ncbi:MAG TPA: folylpolyglutamate synthase/dihydrofolate synthase family protein [Bryobacteraceae bacterium]|jgi:dihydrofolate synthase/folylpolyglutamate synthase